jgi:hypothetical protein
VFGTLAFVVSAASALVSTGLGAVLGPFQTFLTAIFDDALRYALLATLVTLIPRPGVLALSVIVAWLMRGFALGGFNPTDALNVFGHIFWLESCMWAVGVTRSGAWRDGHRVARFLRLGAGFATASLLSALGGLLVHMVLFRLFYAGWYVAALLALPGFLYVWTACLLATGFADSLRRVES